jgi:hypothetical protein
MTSSKVKSDGFSMSPNKNSAYCSKREVLRPLHALCWNGETEPS